MRGNRYKGKSIQKDELAVLVQGYLGLRTKGWSRSKRVGFIRFLLDRAMDMYTRHEEERLRDFHAALGELGIHFPSGRVGREYSYEFSLPEQYGAASLSGLEQLGLQCTREGDFVRLHGNPKSQGRYMVTLEVPMDDGDPLRADFTIEIGANPRDMWQDIPTPAGIKYYKPDNEARFLCPEGGLKRVVAASARGRSHAHNGKPRDDDFGMRYLDNGWYVVTVADGAGSAEYSREGSRAACDALLEACQNGLSTGWLDELVKRLKPERRKELPRELDERVGLFMQGCALAALESVEREADHAKAELRKYATTLLFTLMKHFDGVGWFVAAYGVGDGIVALYSEGEDGASDVSLLTRPDGGDFAGQTHFLTEREQLTTSRVRVAVRQDFTALMLMTDGVSDPKFPHESCMQEASLWHLIWDELSKEVLSKETDEARQEALLQWLGFWAEANHDDRTLLIVH